MTSVLFTSTAEQIKEASQPSALSLKQSIKFYSGFPNYKSYNQLSLNALCKTSPAYDV